MLRILQRKLLNCSDRIWFLGFSKQNVYKVCKKLCKIICKDYKQFFSILDFCIKEENSADELSSALINEERHFGGKIKTPELEGKIIKVWLIPGVVCLLEKKTLLEDL